MTEYKMYDKVLDDEALYWTVKDTKKTLSYGSIINTLASPRNVGKSYSCMELLQEQLNKGKEVAWGRYNKPELAPSITAWQKFNPDLVSKKTDNPNLKVYEDPCTGGSITFFTWSISQNLKGIDGEYTYFVCDEFIPERYTNKSRLDTEFADWSSVYASFRRRSDMKVIMLSNNVYWMNPFYEAWNVIPFGKRKTMVTKDIFTANIDGEEIKTIRRTTNENIGMSKMMVKANINANNIMFSSSAEMQHFYDNQTKAEYTTIKKCPDMSVPLESIQLMSDGYYMGYREYDGMCWFCKIKNDETKETLVSEPQYIDIAKRHYRGGMYIKYFEDVFNMGCCAFDCSETLTHFLRWIRHMRQRL